MFSSLSVTTERTPKTTKAVAPNEDEDDMMAGQWMDTAQQDMQAPQAEASASFPVPWQTLTGRPSR
jgi:hypothetical protein